MTSSKRGADLLVQVLQEQGVERVFALSGNHIMPIFDALFGSGIELIHTRHEAACVHMADAYARVTGKVGVALVTGGPGHANAVSALYTALMSESPVLLLSGHAPHDQLGLGAFQEMRQAEMAAPVCKLSITASSLEALRSEVLQCFQAAASGRPGPVHLSLPTDVLEAVSGSKPFAHPKLLPEGEGMAAKLLSSPLPSGEGLGVSESFRAIITALQQALRPLIITGPATLTRAHRYTLIALEAALGIPVIGTESPRGTGDPSLGAFAEMLAQADCVLLLGKKLDFTLKFGRAPAFAANSTVLQIDPDQTELDRSKRAIGARLTQVVLAQTHASIAALAANAKRHLNAAWLSEVQRALTHRPQAWHAPRGNAGAALQGMLHPVEACRPLQAVLDRHPDAVLVCDGGEFGQWAQACLSAPHRVINGTAGAIGAGISLALGSRSAAAKNSSTAAPIIAFMGDGTFGFHSSEFDTAVRHGLPFIAIVGNDVRWNAEYQIQLKAYGKDRLIGCELLPTRYDEVARAFGGYGESVTEPAQLLPAVERALQSGLPACINVMIQGLSAPNVKLSDA